MEVSDIFIFNGALDSGDITELCTAAPNLITTAATLVNYWPCCTGDGTTSGVYTGGLVAHVGAIDLTQISTPTYAATTAPVLTRTSGASVAISSTDTTIYNGQTGITVTGTGFGTGGGSSAVILSPTDAVDNANAVTQTETGTRSATTVTYTCSLGSTVPTNSTAYLFIKDSSGVANTAGYPVSTTLVPIKMIWTS